MLKRLTFLPFASLLLVWAALTGCERNVAAPLLTPTGERAVAATGVLSGRLDFGGGAAPRSIVFFARVPSTGYTSLYSAIQVIGTFTSWNEGGSPHLIQLAPGTWVDTVSVPSGAISWNACSSAMAARLCPEPAVACRIRTRGGAVRGADTGPEILRRGGHSLARGRLQTGRESSRGPPARQGAPGGFPRNLRRDCRLGFARAGLAPNLQGFGVSSDSRAGARMRRRSRPKATDR